MKIKYAFSIQNEEWDNQYLNEYAKKISDEILLPKVLSKEILENRKGVTFLRCPAHTDFLKNTFVFKSPIDLILDLEITADTARVSSPNLGQNIFEKIIDVRFLSHRESGSSPYPVIGIDFLNLFLSDTSVTMSVFPAFLHYNDFTLKTCIIPGQYDISKWVRPVECVFEVKQSKEKIIINKNDALCYFQFDSDKSSLINLEKIDMPWKEIDICSKLRQENPFRPLKFRYQSLEDFYKDKNV